MKSVLIIHWKDWCWSWNSKTLATWCEELTHWKRPWCWERLKAGVEGDNRGWDCWMVSPTQWPWIWARFRSWWWTGKPGVLQSTGSQRVGHNWATELNWTNNVGGLDSGIMRRSIFKKCFYVVTEQKLWVPCIIQLILMGYLFYVWQCICFLHMVMYMPHPSTENWI